MKSKSSKLSGAQRPKASARKTDMGALLGDAAKMCSTPEGIGAENGSLCAGSSPWISCAQRPKASARKTGEQN